MNLFKRPSTKRYACTAIADSISVTVSFRGSATVGQTNPADSEVSVVGSNLIGRLLGPRLFGIWWKRNFGNVDMPGGPWLGFQLVAAEGNRLFVAVSNELMQIDAFTGTILWQACFGNTPIRHIQYFYPSKTLVIYSDYFGFDTMNGRGNIAAFDDRGTIKWQSEVPVSGDAFLNEPCFNGSFWQATSWEGWVCSIDNETGQIRDKHWTKT